MKKKVDNKSSKVKLIDRLKNKVLNKAQDKETPSISLEKIMKEEMKMNEKISKEFEEKSKKESLKEKISKIKEKSKKIIKEKIPKKSKKLDFKKIKEEIDKDLKGGKIEKHEADILKQRAPLNGLDKKYKGKKKKDTKTTIVTGIPGFDELFDKGIPKGSTVLLAGGAGSGKTILSLQNLAYHAAEGEKCFYMSFEESEERLIGHMEQFGWKPKKLIKAGKLKIKRYSPFDISRSVEAMLAKEKGELLIDIDPVMIPKGFKPDFIVLDSLTAVASAFTGKEDSYRIYIEQLFRFFERMKVTAFLITETEQVPKVFSSSGVEEFLADGVIVLYNFKRGDVRENAIEVLKMRGANHQKKIVAMQITPQGIVVYPDQEIFGETG